MVDARLQPAAPAERPGNRAVPACGARHRCTGTDGYGRSESVQFRDHPLAAGSFPAGAFRTHRLRTGGDADGRGHGHARDGASAGHIGGFRHRCGRTRRDAAGARAAGSIRAVRRGRKPPGHAATRCSAQAVRPASAASDRNAGRCRARTGLDLGRRTGRTGLSGRRDPGQRMAIDRRVRGPGADRRLRRKHRGAHAGRRIRTGADERTARSGPGSFRGAGVPGSGGRSRVFRGRPAGRARRTR